MYLCEFEILYIRNGPDSDSFDSFNEQLQQRVKKAHDDL